MHAPATTRSSVPPQTAATFGVSIEDRIAGRKISMAQLQHFFLACHRMQMGPEEAAGHIKDFMFERYGDFIFYKPRLTTGTIFLWAGPAFFLLIVQGPPPYRVLRAGRIAMSAQVPRTLYD